MLLRFGTLRKFGSVVFVGSVRFGSGHRVSTKQRIHASYLGPAKFPHCPWHQKTPCIIPGAKRFPVSSLTQKDLLHCLRLQKIYCIVRAKSYASSLAPTHFLRRQHISCIFPGTKSFTATSSDTEDLLHLPWYQNISCIVPGARRFSILSLAPNEFLHCP